MSIRRSEATAGSALRPVASLAAAILGIAAAMPAHAQGSPGGWQFEITPYVWTTGLNGETQTPTMPNTKVDMSFGDIFDALDFALSGAFEARNGKWGVLADAQYYKLSADGTSLRTGPLGNTLTASANLEIKQRILAAAVAYRVSEGSSPVDVVGGLRYTKLNVETRADFTLLGLAGGGSRGGDKSWVDPYVGVRLKHPLSDQWAVTGYADMGGFGAGADFTWQLQAGMEYRVSDKYAVSFGYRILEVDYNSGGFVYDMKTDGLYVGLGIRF